MRNRKAPARINPSGACIAFLLKRCFYVHGALLSVARYPKARAKIGRIDERNKKLLKKLRKSYVNGKKNGRPLAPELTIY